MSDIIVRPIGRVSCPRNEICDDFWGEVISTIEIDSAQFGEECLMGLSEFSHIEVLYHFHLVDENAVVKTAEHPRENKLWPKVGIFAQRKKNRPNRIGVSTCQLIEVHGRALKVKGLDAIDGTPILDVKPYVKEFGPRGTVRQPQWISQLMVDYFK